MNQKRAKCKLCRRANKKLFLKGERCSLAKCAMIKKPYAPGQHAKKAPMLTEFGRQLAQKQIFKWTYDLNEKQFRKYYEEVSHKEGNFGDLLIAKLESRLDNIVYRLGFAASRREARQLVGHGFFLVNGKKVSVPSFNVKAGDEITFKGSKEKKAYMELLKVRLDKKSENFPVWLEMSPKELKGKVLTLPGRAEVDPGANAQAVTEFYSR